MTARLRQLWAELLRAKTRKLLEELETVGGVEG